MKLSSVTAAGAAFGLAAATAIPHKQRSLHRRQVPQEQSHGFVLQLCNDFMKLDNTLNIQDCVFGMLGNAAAEEGAGDVTNLDCLKQESADQAFTNAKAAQDVAGMSGALLFMAIERNSGSVGAKSVLCDQPARNPEIGSLTQHQDAASADAPELNKAVTLELARQLAAIGADPNLALLSGTFAPGDPNDPTGAGNSCDTVDLELGCIFTEKLLVLDATEDEIAAAVADVEQTFTGTGGIFATDLVNLADFTVAEVTGEPFDLAQVTPGSGAAATDGADAVVTETPATTTTGAGAIQTELTDVITTTASPAEAGKAAGQCSLVTATVGADQTDALLGQYPTAVIGMPDKAAATSAAAEKETAAAAADECTGGDAAGNTNNNNDAADDAAQVAGGNLQAFTGAIGGLPPPVVDSGSGDRPFEVNGAAFDNQASALIRSCDIQNNQCFNAINGGEIDEDTSVCGQQLDECRAAAGGAARRRARRARRSTVPVLGSGAAKVLVGGQAAVASPVVVAPGFGGLIGGQGVIVGGNVALVQNLNLAQLLGTGVTIVNLGNIAGGANLGSVIGGGNFVLAPSVGQQQQLVVELVQCS